MGRFVGFAVVLWLVCVFAPAGALSAGDVNAVVDRVAVGQPVVVSLGDSFIAGEAGRWRGNVASGSNYLAADALGPTAYWDTDTGESVPGCHRSKGAEINVPGEVGVNLACSGSTTRTRWDGGAYKPGVDWGMIDARTGLPLPGQLTLLDRLARRATVRLVVLSVGGNDMGFSTIVQACIAAFARPRPFQSRCRDDANVRALLSDARLRAVGVKVQQAIERVHTTMRDAGYENGQWSLAVQNYPQPIAKRIRFAETYRGRVYAGGCPFYDADVRWIDSRLAVLTREITRAARAASARTGQPTAVLDITTLFAGRELCAVGTARVDHLSPTQIVARAERVSMVRTFAPFRTEESIHPNFLGQQALMACLRAAWDGANVTPGRCDAPANWATTDGVGLPLVRFTPLP